MARIAPRFNCGWSLSTETRKAILAELNAWNPEDKISCRDKHICQLAFKKDMNAAQIERLQDPFLKNQWGQELTAKGILSIIYRHFPQLRRKRGYSVKTEGHRKRLDLLKDYAALTANKPRICAICGSVKELRLHHIVPVDHGGTNDPVNLIFLCDNCHRALHSRIYKTWGLKGQARKPLQPMTKPQQKPQTPKHKAPLANQPPITRKKPPRYHWPETPRLKAKRALNEVLRGETLKFWRGTAKGGNQEKIAVYIGQRLMNGEISEDNARELAAACMEARLNGMDFRSMANSIKAGTFQST